MENNKFILIHPKHFTPDLQIVGALGWKLQQAMGVYKRDNELTNGKPSFSKYESNNNGTRIEWVILPDVGTPYKIFDPLFGEREVSTNEGMWVILRQSSGPLDPHNINDRWITAFDMNPEPNTTSISNIRASALDDDLVESGTLDIVNTLSQKAKYTMPKVTDMINRLNHTDEDELREEIMSFDSVFDDCYVENMYNTDLHDDIIRLTEDNRTLKKKVKNQGKKISRLSKNNTKMRNEKKQNQVIYDQMAAKLVELESQKAELVNKCEKLEKKLEKTTNENSEVTNKCGKRNSRRLSKKTRLSECNLLQCLWAKFIKLLMKRVGSKVRVAYENVSWKD